MKDKVSKHSLSKSLVLCLFKFHEARCAVKIKELFMPNLSQVTNSVKLKHWGFIKRVSDPANHWRITKAGERFLFNETIAPKVLLTRSDEVVGYQGDHISVCRIDGYFERPKFHIYQENTNDGQAVFF